MQLRGAAGHILSSTPGWAPREKPPPAVALTGLPKLCASAAGAQEPSARRENPFSEGS